jgi:hypothetical protein
MALRYRSTAVIRPALSPHAAPSKIETTER